MSQQLQVVNYKSPVVTEQQLKTYLSSMGSNLKPEHQTQFIELAKAFNLNPFKREIYGVSYKDNFNIIVGFEVYLKRAEASGQLEGWRAWTEGNKPDLKACVEIKRRDWSEPYYHEVYFEEYKQENKMWSTKPRTMLKKVAIAQGFRLAFPLELGGIPYMEDELPDLEITDVTTKEKKNSLVINKLYTKIKAHGLSDEEIPDFAKFANFSRDDIDSCWCALNRFNKLFQDYQNSKAIDHESL
ncbi:phage recombination protein Bet [bacterium SCSIO 12844]|nr:phage recombination protein Bet [bacterium SCSIO 12844]